VWYKNANSKFMTDNKHVSERSLLKGKYNPQILHKVVKKRRKCADSSGERSHKAVSKSERQGFHSSNDQNLCSACPEGDKRHSCYPDEDGNQNQLCSECAACNGVWT
jgi:hypothetical protein